VQFCASDVDWTKTQWKDLSIVDLITNRPKPESATKKPSSPVEEQQKDNGGETMSGIARSNIEEFMASYTSSPWSRIQRKSLVNMGLDSLEIVQLRNQFNKHFKVNVPLKVVAEPSQKIGELVTALEQYM
jgi:acyl carrier protein